METASTEVTSNRHRNDIEKSRWKTYRYFVDFESWIHVEMSTSNRCHNVHLDSPFKIDVISMNFPRGISALNRWRIDENVSIGMVHLNYFLFGSELITIMVKIFARVLLDIDISLRKIWYELHSLHTLFLFIRTSKFCLRLAVLNFFFIFESEMFLFFF